MHNREWKAIWTDQDGTPQECIFVACDSYIFAEMSFQGSRVDQGQPVPEFFTLSPGEKVVQVIPGLKELVEQGTPESTVGGQR